jgi:hypothetical protein
VAFTNSSLVSKIFFLLCFLHGIYALRLAAYLLLHLENLETAWLSTWVAPGIIAYVYVCGFA